MILFYFQFILFLSPSPFLPSLPLSLPPSLPPYPSSSFSSPFLFSFLLPPLSSLPINLFTRSKIIYLQSLSPPSLLSLDSSGLLLLFPYSKKYLQSFNFFHPSKKITISLENMGFVEIGGRKIVFEAKKGGKEEGRRLFDEIGRREDLEKNLVARRQMREEVEVSCVIIFF